MKRGREYRRDYDLEERFALAKQPRIPFRDPELEDEGEDEIPFKPFDEIEKKYCTLQIGDLTTVSGLKTKWLASPLSVPFRMERPMISVGVGTDSNQRIGEKIFPARASVRLITYWDPLDSPYQEEENGWNGYEGGCFRFFVFVDKVKQWKQTYPDAGYSLGAGNGANSAFTPGRGFLQNGSIHSFYNPDTIKNYRILIDTGVIHQGVKYAGVNYAQGEFGETRDPGLVSVASINVNPAAQVDTAIVSGADFEEDIVDTSLYGGFSGTGAFEIPLGVGGGEFAFAFDPLITGIYASQVRARSKLTLAEGDLAIVKSTAEAMNRIRYTKPKPCTKTYEWNIDLKTLESVFDRSAFNPAVDPFPTHGDIRWGVIYISNTMNLCYQVDTRVEYYDS